MRDRYVPEPQIIVLSGSWGMKCEWPGCTNGAPFDGYCAAHAEVEPNSDS